MINLMKLGLSMTRVRALLSFSTVENAILQLDSDISWFILINLSYITSPSKKVSERPHGSGII